MELERLTETMGISTAKEGAALTIHDERWMVIKK